MLDISSWNLSQAGYSRFYVEWCENLRCLKSSIFNVFKNLIVIILQSEMWFIIFFLKSKMPLNLCWNMKFQKIRSTRTAWKQSQHFMKYIWSHGMFDFPQYCVDLVKKSWFYTEVAVLIRNWFKNQPFIQKNVWFQRC